MDKSCFIICRAAAGSGKTYTLVRQYIELAFDAPEQELSRRYRRILAITFTNKAANEMKERILHDLADIAAHGIAVDIGCDIATHLGMDNDTLQRYGTIVHSAIMHNYSDFGVCTIDSFMHRIVRTFAHDLNLPINFDLQVEKSELTANAVDRLMTLVGTEGEESLTAILCEQAELKMNEDKSYQLDDWLKNQVDELFGEDAPEYLVELKRMDSSQFRQVYGEMLQANAEYERQMILLGQQAVETYSAQGLAIEDFYQGSKGVGKYFANLAKGEMKSPNNMALAYLEGDKLGAGKCNASTKESLAAVKPKLQELYRQAERLQQGEGVRYNSRRLMMTRLYSLAVLNRLNELMTEYARENNIVHISEFNKRISAVVQEEDQPFVYERIGTRYHNYLIDEFQDTSRMQWQNLVPLLADGIGGGHTSMVVGDGKQAIYRFRQGDVDQFIALPHVSNSRHGQILAHPAVTDIMPLYTNYRSAERIVRFNNDFFGWLIPHRFEQNQQLQDIYIGHGERAGCDPQPEGRGKPELYQHHRKDGGYVQVGFWPEDRERGLEVLWEQVVADLHLLHDGKGWQWRDITLLALKKDSLSKAAAYLTQQGIPVVSDESFRLSNSRTVMMLRFLTQYLRDANDRVAATNVALCLHALGVADTPDINSLPPGIHPALHCDHLRTLSLYDCCEEVLRCLRLDGIETAYVNTFLNILSAYCGKHRQDLGEFIEWFDKNVENWYVGTAGDLDAIRLMTIHKAKGLESPIVMIPLLSGAVRNDPIWVHIPAEQGLQIPVAQVCLTKDTPTVFDEAYRQEQQRRETDIVNLLYVAFTRPKNQLYLYGIEPKKTDGTDFSSLVSIYMPHLSDATEVRPGAVAVGTIDDKATAGRKESVMEQEELHRVTFPDWSDRIAIAQQSDQCYAFHDDKALRRGNQLHELLSLTHNSNECDAALEYYARRNHLDPSERETLREILREITTAGAAAHFFNPAYPCKNECPIAWRGEVLRPDRIVLAESETWVVDFKTGQPRIEHQAQVQHYCEAIQAMGYPKVSGHLLYIGRNGHCSVQRV